MLHNLNDSLIIMPENIHKNWHNCYIKGLRLGVKNGVSTA